jgi:CheY-like chemotaxis protein
MSVELTEDGDLVVARAAAGEVDVVVMDVSLGNTKVAGSPVDGLELTRLLLAAAAGAGRKVRVLIATAHAMRGDRERFLGTTGAHGYVAKPITDHPAFAAEVRRLYDELDGGPA